MTRQTVTIHGTRFVMVEETRLRQLEALARKVEPQLPLLPPADARGNRPALEYIRSSIARDIIQERRTLGLSQARLAELAGIRQETLVPFGVGQTLADSADGGKDRCGATELCEKRGRRARPEPNGSPRNDFVPDGPGRPCLRRSNNADIMSFLCASRRNPNPSLLLVDSAHKCRHPRFPRS